MEPLPENGFQRNPLHLGGRSSKSAPVICDREGCGENWSGRPEGGGCVIVGRVWCPECTRKILARSKIARRHAVRCPPGVAFAAWVAGMRSKVQAPRPVET